MRYVMRQKFFSFGDSFSIQNEFGTDLYYVRGKVFSFGDQLSFQDINGNELAFIRQKLLSWSPTYEIYHGEQLYASLKKELFTFFACKFDIELSNGGCIEVEGNFFDYEYTFRHNGQIIATVSKEWFSWTDTYGIDVADGEEDVFILACAVAIDMICHNDKKH